jgi:hypothetical protein
MKDPRCGNCLLFDRDNEVCKVAILLEGEKFYLPVSAGDRCHMDELGVEVNQVRWWVEDPVTGEKTDKNGVVKVEYPNFKE